MFKITFSSIKEELKKKYNKEIEETDCKFETLKSEDLLKYGEMVYENQGFNKPVTYLALIISFVSIFVAMVDKLETWSIYLFSGLIFIFLVLVLVLMVLEGRKTRKLNILKKHIFFEKNK